MVRFDALIVGSLAVTVAVAVPAHAQNVARYEPGMASSGRRLPSSPALPYLPSAEPFVHRLDPQQVSQVRRWGDVGRCVADLDRDASRSYVTARSGSPEAAAAEQRLDPAFATCLARSGVKRQGNRSFRRAAVADALGMRVPSRS